MSETQTSGAAALRITLVRSTIGRPKDQEATVRALGLRRMHHTVERPDNPSIRGMVTKIRHLVRVEELQAGAETVPLEGTNRPAVAVGSPFARYVAPGDEGAG